MKSPSPHLNRFRHCAPLTPAWPLAGRSFLLGMLVLTAWFNGLGQNGQCVNPPSGLVGWWRGEPDPLIGANLVVDDWDSNHGTASLAMRYATGRVGQAFSLQQHSIRVLDIPALHFTNEFTIEAWINPYSIVGERTIISKCVGPFAGAGQQHSYYFGLTNNQLIFQVSSTGRGADSTTLVSLQSLPPYQWSHVAATFGQGILRFYINGQEDTKTNHAGGIFPGSTDLGIGAIPLSPTGTSATSYFFGLMDEISLYRRTLSESEIQSIYNADFLGKCPAPPIITQQPHDQVIPLGEDVRFTVAVTGGYPLRYQWQFNGLDLPGATNPALLLEKINPTQAGLYSVTVSNLAGVSPSSNASLSLLPAPSCTAVPAGLISWWSGDNTTTDVTSANAISSYYPGTYPTGKVGQAFTLNNPASGYIRVNDSPSLNFNTNDDFSIEMWIKANPTNLLYPNMPLFEKRTVPGPGAATGIGYSLSLYQGRLALWLGVAPGQASNVVQFISSGPDLRDGMFHHVAVSLSRAATNGGVLFVDGLPVLTFNPLPYRGNLRTTAYLNIGAPTLTVSNSSFRGLIDEPAIYRRALTVEEILAIRQAGAAGKCRASIPSKPSIVVQPVSQVVNLVSSKYTTNVTFSVIATGGPTLSYQWFKDRGTIILPQQGGDQPTLVLTNVTSRDSGTYWVRVTNLLGAATSSNAQLIVNYRPFAESQSVVTQEDSPTYISLTGLADNRLTYLIDTPPTNGTLSGIAPKLLYTPNTNANGVDRFVFKVNDGYADSAPATVLINIAPVNDAPVALSQIVATDEDTGLPIALGAYDVDGDLLTFRVTPPAHGSLRGTAPDLVYTPEQNYTGEDVFTFTVQDRSRGVSQIAAVSITVRLVNNAPVAKLVVSPLGELPGVTNIVALAPACCDTTLRLDASGSTDVENDQLTYAWVEGTNVLSTDVIATNCFKPGTHEITLLVGDGTAVITASVTVEIITPAEAVDFLKTLVEAGIPDRRASAPLVSWLRQASEAFEGCRADQGVKFLVSFKQRVQDRIAPKDGELARALIETAAAIIDAATDCDPSQRLSRRN